MEEGGIDQETYVSMPIAGKDALDTLQTNIGNARAEVSSYVDQFKEINKFAQGVSKCPCVVENRSVSWTQLLEDTTLKDLWDASEWLRDEVGPSIVKDACEEFDEELGNSPGEGDASREVPGQLFLKHAYFKVQRTKDSMKSVQQTHAKLTERYQKKVDQRSKTTAREKERNLKGLEDWVARNESDKASELNEMRLARRNQLNRARKGVKKVKKDRAETEEKLPEALGKSYVMSVGHHFVRFD